MSRLIWFVYTAVFIALIFGSLVAAVVFASRMSEVRMETEAQQCLAEHDRCEMIYGNWYPAARWDDA